MNNDALFDLTGMIAVVTGGGDGIGYCISLPHIRLDQRSDTDGERRRCLYTRLIPPVHATIPALVLSTIECLFRLLFPEQAAVIASV